MIVDTSAVIAILRSEPEAKPFLEKVIANGGGLISAGSWIELGPVLSNLADSAISARLQPLCDTINLRIAPVTVEQAEIGRKAYREYGKGHHRARLNYGDCFAYALAKATGEPLLCKGDDFVHTDLVLT